ncbi:MAG: 5-oxoprolinase subunit PxpB [Bacillota bacterium]|nr:5-oxoprolinase subunit PxpB [Bacillota bacterium]MDW7677180.1 5-oxoprolinase subunit PxpB [Bacillota bacterium]
MLTPGKILTAGDSAVVMEFGNEISEAISSRVRAMQLVLEKKAVNGITELVPTYRSLMIHYNPRIMPYKDLCDQLKLLAEQLEDMELPAPEVIEIPTLYGGESGPDLGTVARHNHLTAEEVIEIHSSRDYLIYMLGFTPGFPYLGGMDSRIATPRLANPRTKIKGGSVGIAGSQTGIYSIDSPGGWQIIGWTPVPLFEATAQNPFLLKAGHYIRFKPISSEDCHSIMSAVENKSYQCRIASLAKTAPPLPGGETLD